MNCINTYEATEAAALYVCSCSKEGAEILHMSYQEITIIMNMRNMSMKLKKLMNN